jgi:hypothetical protein
VTIDTGEPAYPLRRNTDTIYPVGRFTTTLAGPELADALDHNRVKQLHWAAWYEMGRPLSSFCDTIYALRCRAEEEENKPLAAYSKRLLVTLPGKIGQRSKVWEESPKGDGDVLYGEWFGRSTTGFPTRYRSIAGYVQREVDMGFAPDSVPAMASFVTSAGRIRLLQAIRCAGWDHVYYCDTDSLFVDQAGRDRLELGGWIKPGVLGKLQVKSGPGPVEIRGIKYYVEDGRTVCAGMPRGIAEPVGDGLHEWQSMVPSQYIRKGLRPGTIRVLHQYKRTVQYTHGIVGSDGRVAPFYLE